MNAYIVKKPVITEKSLQLAKKSNVYTFVVDRNANRAQIKDAIISLFKVDVLSVNVVMIQRSKKKTGKKRLTVVVPRMKKAYVKIKKDQSIDLFDVGGND
jgi:large subunit ribosomal protein L23